MAYFNRDNRGGDRGPRRSFGGGRGGFGGRSNDRGDRQMHDAICSNCGKACQVPFRPTGDKPVYCSECFETMGNRSDDRGGDRRNDRPRYSDRRSEDRPRGEGRPQSSGDMSQIAVKLDKIISLLERMNVPAQPKVETVKAEVVAGPKEKKTVKKAPSKKK